MNFQILCRLALAGLLGALIGLDREAHSKAAGTRTHFLVALGSALFMIISLYGFGEVMPSAGVRGADQARIAAQIVSGIGFIGAGMIMLRKQIVQGLTTAAGIWVAAGIGMGVGCGLYIIAIFVTGFALLGLELLGFLTRKFKGRVIFVVLTTKSKDAVTSLLVETGKNDIHILEYNLSQTIINSEMTYRIEATLRNQHGKCKDALLAMLEKHSEIILEKIE